MYLGIDVGASKTLAAIFDKSGEIIRVQKIPTPQEYSSFIKDLAALLNHADFKQAFSAVCCALPGRIDRKTGTGLRFGNLPWQDVPVKDDLYKILGDVPIFIENDAKTATLYEAQNNRGFQKVVYLTISTGIGVGYAVGGRLEPNFLDAEVGSMLLPHEDKLQKWEAFASGKALKRRYGKPASGITDQKIWAEYVELLIPGFEAVIVTFQPDAIIVGGGVGAHLEKFGDLLSNRLREVSGELAVIPPIIKAKKAEEAVIYGCYELIKQNGF